jgi:hypothetical protein
MEGKVMAQSIDLEELSELIETATEVERFDYTDPEDEDAYLNAVLAKAADGRHFSYLEATGMNTAYAGAGNCEGEWLSDAQTGDWTSRFQ